MEDWDHYRFSLCGYPVFPSFVEETIHSFFIEFFGFLLFFCVFFWVTCETLIDHIFVGLFQGSLFLHWYHTVLITLVLQFNLKSGSIMSLALFYFLMVALAIWDILRFHINFKGFFGGEYPWDFYKGYIDSIEDIG